MDAKGTGHLLIEVAGWTATCTGLCSLLRQSILQKPVRRPELEFPVHYIFSYIPSLCLPHARVTSLEDPVSFSAECPWPPSRTNMVIATTCWDVLHLLLRNIFQRYRSLPLSSACCIHPDSWSSRTFFEVWEAHSLLWLYQLLLLSSLLPNNAPTMGTVLLLRLTKTF